MNNLEGKVSATLYPSSIAFQHSKYFLFDKLSRDDSVFQDHQPYQHLNNSYD